jgi:predicted dehydrogenase
MAQALEDPEVDCVLIATPHHLHATMIETAAQAGRHVIVEKPLATHRVEAMRVIDACRERRVALSICHPRRYEEKIRYAANLVREGVIGKVLLTTSCFYKVKSAGYWQRSGWRGLLQQSGGGVGIMNLVHHLDALESVTGDTIEDLKARGATLASPIEVEDCFVGFLRYSGGALGTLAAGTAVPGPTVAEDSFLGSEGRVVVGKRSVKVVSTDTSHWDPKRWIVRTFPDDVKAKVRFVDEFCKAVLSGEPVPVGPDYGLHLLDRILSSGIPAMKGSCSRAG